VQQAAYSLLSEERKAELHLKMGRLLLGRSEYTPQDSDLFKVADHLNRGAVLMTNSAERKQLACLNLAAGRKARGSRHAQLDALVRVSLGQRAERAVS